MKTKITFILIAFLVLVPLAACGQKAAAPTPTPPPVVRPTAAPTSPPVVRPTAAPTPTPKSEWDTLVEAAKKEGEVTALASSIGNAAPQSTAIFGQKFGIGLSYTQGRGSEIAKKITSERQAGIYTVDVVITGLGTFYNSLNPMKIAVPLEPLIILPEVKDGSKWRTGKLQWVTPEKTGVAISLNSLTYTAIHTETIKPGEITSTEDILDPKWKGKIVINDPSVAGKGAEWFTFIMAQAYPGEKGMEYIKKLIAQEPVVIRDQRLQAEWVARGKYPVGLGIESSEIKKFSEAGAPIAELGMKEGQPLTSGPWNIMVLDKAPHPNATKLFVNWLMSKEGGEVVAKHSGYLSARLDVPTTGFDPILVPGDNDILPGEAYKLEQGRLLKVAAELFAGMAQ